VRRRTGGVRRPSSSARRYGGLAKVWHEQGFGAVPIPMLEQADSLNVAPSAGILLFEARARKGGW
jgi:TrmH family RNA methyltransferase